MTRGIRSDILIMLVVHVIWMRYPILKDLKQILMCACIHTRWWLNWDSFVVAKHPLSLRFTMWNISDTRSLVVVLRHFMLPSFRWKGKELHRLLPFILAFSCSLTAILICSQNFTALPAIALDRPAFGYNQVDLCKMNVTTIPLACEQKIRFVNDETSFYEAPFSTFTPEVTC